MSLQSSLVANTVHVTYWTGNKKERNCTICFYFIYEFNTTHQTIIIFFFFSLILLALAALSTLNIAANGHMHRRKVLNPISEPSRLDHDKWKWDDERRWNIMCQYFFLLWWWLRKKKKRKETWNQLMSSMVYPVFWFCCCCLYSLLGVEVHLHQSRHHQKYGIEIKTTSQLNHICFNKFNATREMLVETVLLVL